MLDGSGQLKDVAGDGADFVAVPRTTTHWYRFDPNRPTVDQLRATEKNSKQRSFQEKSRRIGDNIEGHFRRMRRWRIFGSFLKEVQIYLSFFR